MRLTLTKALSQHFRYRKEFMQLTLYFEYVLVRRSDDGHSCLNSTSNTNKDNINVYLLGSCSISIFRVSVLISFYIAYL